VVFGAKLRVDGWACKEVGADDGPYTVGNLEAGRDYWFVYGRLNNGVATPIVELVDRDASVVARLDTGREVETDNALVTEQSLRCRVAAALNAAATAVEAHQPIGPHIAGIRDEIQGLDDVVRMRPLVMRLLAQLEETIEMAAAMPVFPMPRGLFRSPAAGPDFNHFATRMVSGGAVFGLQRGISGPGHGPELFASPSQALAAQSTSEAYSITDPTQA
jgi:hypothetical protein